MEKLKNAAILGNIRSGNLDDNPNDMKNLVEWLSTSPTYTTFRINMLREPLDLSILDEVLKQQSEELNVMSLPNHYFLRPDCLIVKQWPTNAFMNQQRKEVIVDALCGTAVLRGAHVFAPGVMGLPTNVELNEIVDVYADVEGKCKRGLKMKFEGEKTFVGTGFIKMLRYNLFDQGVQPSGVAVKILIPASCLPVLNEAIYPKGDVLLQNLPSLVCGWVVDARPGETILDMCAAPGNKTTHLAEMSLNKAHIIALDKTAQKVARIKENCSVHGVTCVNAYVYDSTVSYSEVSSSATEGPPYPDNSFDKILLDAPCSGLGQRPQFEIKMTVKSLRSYHFVQRKLFTAAVKLLKTGGKLVYSTCTLNQEENEDIVKWALDKFPYIKLIAAEPLLGGPGWAGCGLTDDQRILLQRFGPELDELRPVDDLYRDTIGFFIACFTKTE